MISLTGLQLLSHQRNNLFWGDSLRYAIRDNYSFQGKLLDLTNTRGVAGILKQLSGQNSSANDYDFLYVNDTFLGLAQINNLSYSNGLDVREKNYTINATVFTSGNTSNLNSSISLYSGVNLSSQLFPVYLIENFTEEFNSEISEDGTYSEQQRIQLKFVSGAALGTFQNPIGMAQQFSQNLINSNPAIGFVNSFYSGWRQKQGKRLHFETANLITNEYSISESFKTLRDISGSYAINYSNSLQLDDNGVTTVKENGKVQGLIPDTFGSYYPAALSGEQYEVQNFSYSRCNDIFNTYLNSFIQGQPAIINFDISTWGEDLYTFNFNGDIMTIQIRGIDGGSPMIGNYIIQTDGNTVIEDILFGFSDGLSNLYTILTVDISVSPTIKVTTPEKNVNQFLSVSSIGSNIVNDSDFGSDGFYTLGNHYPLNLKHITYGQTLNKFIDTVQYEVSYSNNPKLNDNFSWEYTQTAERDKTECTYKIIEDGSIQGYSDCAPGKKYSNAVNGFNEVKTGIYNRSYNFYTGFSQFANPIKLIEQSDARDKIKGIIKYSQVFTDNLIYSYSGVKKMIITVNDDFSVPGKNTFDIVGYKQIAQPNNIMTLAKRDLQLDIVGFRGTDLTGYLNVAINTINSNIPSGTDPYISNINYNFNPRANSFTIANEWVYYNSGLDLNKFLL